MTVTLLTKEERKALIERLVQYDRETHGFRKDELKYIRKLYSKWDDAKLMSVRFN
jgi:hypothetical protein